MRLRLIVPLALIGAVLVPTAAQAETRYLDAYDRGRDKYAGPMRMKEPLQRRVPYVLIARGTASFFDSAAYAQGCGSFPEPRPIYPSPRRRNGLVGLDPEFIFAEPRIARRCQGDNPPFRVKVFQVSTRRAFRHPPLLGPNPTRVAPDHRYRYPLIGAGARPRFRISDPFARDNYGRFRLTVRRARAADCLLEDYLKFGYDTEEECVTATQRGRRPAPAPTTPPA